MIANSYISTWVNVLANQTMVFEDKHTNFREPHISAPVRITARHTVCAVTFNIEIFMRVSTYVTSKLRFDIDTHFVRIENEKNSELLWPLWMLYRLLRFFHRWQDKKCLFFLKKESVHAWFTLSIACLEGMSSFFSKTRLFFFKIDIYRWLI